MLNSVKVEVQDEVKMPRVIPFSAILYNPDKVDAGRVMAPPYDIITPPMHEYLYNMSPYNIVHIDYGKELPGDTEKDNRYTRASGFLVVWLKQGILIRDSRPAFYCYEIQYSIGPVEKRLRGFIGLVRLEELEEGRIHPHENTHPGPKMDRLNLLKACNANTSPILSLYSSKEKIVTSILDEVSNEMPFISAVDLDGFMHRVWPIKDDVRIRALMTELEGRAIFIADGHHRYETALSFKDEMTARGLLKTGAEPFNYVMMFLSNMEESGPDRGLTLLPVHRLVKEMKGSIDELQRCFDITPVNLNGNNEVVIKDRLLSMLKRTGHSFGVYLKTGGCYHIVLRQGLDDMIDAPPPLRGLDVTILHKLIFENLLRVKGIDYEMQPDEAIRRVKGCQYEAAFFLNPPQVKDVKEVALASERMPQKSTYFYPKLLTGMVINKFS